MKLFESVKSFFINLVASRLGIPKTAIVYLRPILYVSKKLKFGLPKDLISINAVMFMRGLLNRIVIDTNRNWIWPYWVVKQYDPNSISFMPRGFQIPSLNMAHRNWTSIGCLNSRYEAVVDERGLVMPYINCWSLDFWLIYKGEIYAPSQLEQVQQFNEDKMPVVVTEFEVDKIIIRATVFANKINDRNVIFHKLEAENIGDEYEKLSLVYSIRPYNPEGMSVIKNIHYNQDGEFYVNRKLGVVLKDPPSKVICRSYSRGDVSQFIRQQSDSNYKVKCNAGLATAAAEYEVTIKPKGSYAAEARVPMDPIPLIKGSVLKEADYLENLTQYKSEIKISLQDTMELTIPDKNLEDGFNINKAYMLLFYDGNRITPGPFSYHKFWFRDAAYMLHGLNLVGFSKLSRSVLNTYPKRQWISGFFYSQMGEWDSNGQAIWSLYDYYKITGDKEFLASKYPIIKRGANWIIRKLNETKKDFLPYKNLMPPGLSAEHFGMNDYYYWDDFWALAGLRETVKTCYELNIDESVYNKFHQAYLDLYKAIDNSLDYISYKFKMPIIPISPNRFMDSASIGSISSIYPLNIYTVHNPRVENTVRYLKQYCFSGDGFFHDVNHSGFGTYLTTHIIQHDIYKKDYDAWRTINWLLDVASATYTWPESIHPHSKGGLIGDGHHGWAATDFLVMVRNLMLHEERDVLVLTPIMPKEWLKKGEKLIVKKAPTYFGEVSFSYDVKEGYIDISINAQYHNAPKEIEINLPLSIKQYYIDEILYHPEKSNQIIVPPNTKKIKVLY